MIVECTPEQKAAYQPRGKASNPDGWKPPHCPGEIPAAGVRLHPEGLFHRFFHRNIDYLLDSFSEDELLYSFRLRAGVENPPRERDIHKLFGFWTEGLRGSEAGRFLMGAANTLRWTQHPELERRLRAVVDGIAECQEEDGYVFAFDRKEYKYWEQGNYARNWFTQGMVDAGHVYPKAWEVMRRGHDWFNQCEWLPDLIYLSLGLQGHPASLSLYFTPVGKPEDIATAERFYVQDWWLDRLKAGDLEAIWKYPLERPHCYEIAGFEAYLDHYLATGDLHFLDAMTKTWEMLRKHWQHIGGSWALCEGQPYPPDTYILYSTGEYCGSVFWIKFCQRFHRLYPLEEKYVAEIEKSLYNIALANQTEDGIRYHALLDGHKERPKACNTCCELHGTRVYAALPEYIYSRHEDGVMVNLFDASSYEGEIGGEAVAFDMATSFPFDPEVTITLKKVPARAWTLFVRIPSWATAPVPVQINGETAQTGQPGGYLALRREWSAGDVVSFSLPAGLRHTRYTGVDQPHWMDRYALEYGPVLMACVGVLDRVDSHTRSIKFDFPARELLGRLRPIPSRPLHYRVDGCIGYEYMPYWQIGFESYSAIPCFTRGDI